MFNYFCCKYFVYCLFTDSSHLCGWMLYLHRVKGDNLFTCKMCEWSSCFRPNCI